MNEVVERNIERMLGNQKGDMIPLLLSESMGGNADYYGKYPCQAANFCYEPDTGKIMYFENPQSLPIELRGFPKNFFRLAFLWQNESKYRIVKPFPENIHEEVAQDNILKTIGVYNHRHGFANPLE
ncbi:hypothetical protein GOV08_02185 [Candidatus Woesearchaeota archaeon]|nr:hypothetical protein [Candidatus Woesearchaeota archaeon]